MILRIKILLLQFSYFFYKRCVEAMSIVQYENLHGNESNHGRLMTHEDRYRKKLNPHLEYATLYFEKRTSNSFSDVHISEHIYARILPSTTNVLIIMPKIQIEKFTRNEHKALSRLIGHKSIVLDEYNKDRFYEHNDLVEFQKFVLVERLTFKLYFRSLVLILKYIHERDIVHANLNFDTIFLDVDGNLKIRWFNMCHVIIRKKKLKFLSILSEKKHDSEFPEYIPKHMEFLSPEIINKSSHITPSADIYSLGKILETLMKIDLKHRTNDLSDLISQMCAEDPKKRISLDDILKHDWLKECYVDLFDFSYLNDGSYVFQDCTFKKEGKRIISGHITLVVLKTDDINSESTKLKKKKQENKLIVKIYISNEEKKLLDIDVETMIEIYKIYSYIEKIIKDYDIEF